MRRDRVVSLFQSHQSSACGDGHCPTDGSRLPESHPEELCPGTDQDTSQLVRRWRSQTWWGLGPLGGPNPQTCPHPRSFNVQMCVGATGHNIPQKLSEWHGGSG